MAGTATVAPAGQPANEASGMAPERWELALYCAAFAGAIVASAWWPGVWGA